MLAMSQNDALSDTFQDVGHSYRYVTPVIASPRNSRALELTDGVSARVSTPNRNLPVLRARNYYKAKISGVKPRSGKRSVIACYGLPVAALTQSASTSAAIDR